MSPLDMPNRPTVVLRPTIRLAYRTSTSTAERDRKILAERTDLLARAERDWPACCETGDKSLSRITGCTVCTL